MNLKKIWAKTLPVPFSLSALAVLVGVGLFAASLLVDLYATHVPQTYVITRTVETEVSKELPQKTIECVAIQAKAPSPKQAEKIERKFDLDLSELELLSIQEIPRLPNGGEGALTLDKSGQVGLTISPYKGRLFKFGGPFEISAGVAYSMDLGQGFTAEIRKDLLTLGRYSTVVIDGGVSGRMFPEAIDPDDRSDIQIDLRATYRSMD